MDSEKNTSPVGPKFRLPNLCQPSINNDRYRWYDVHRIRQSCYIPSSDRSVEGKWGGSAILPMIRYGSTILPMITFGSAILPMIDLEVLFFPWSIASSQAPIVTEISCIAPNTYLSYFLSSAHALYLENYDSYDIWVFGNRLITTNLPGVGVIRFTLWSILTLLLYLKV